MHFHRENLTPTTCAAFPEQIPWQILAGMNDHMVSTGNDKGIIYQLDPTRQQLLDRFYEWSLTDAAEDLKLLILAELEKQVEQ
jgi:hypothetical protein